jgi:type VI secretion system protein
MNPFSRRRALVGGTAIALLPGCAAYDLLFATRVAVRWIEIRVAAGINENSPVALDLVHLSANRTLTEEVAKMTAEDWFGRKAQLRRDFRDEVDVRSWEVVPGQLLPRTWLERPQVNRAAFLFARYRAPGAHRYRLTENDTDILVVLDAPGFSVTPQ